MCMHAHSISPSSVIFIGYLGVLRKENIFYLEYGT